MNTIEIKKENLCLIILFFLLEISFGQQIEFTKKYTFSQGSASSFIELQDSGFIITGGLADSNFNGYSGAIRINKFGDTIWTKRFTPLDVGINDIAKINDTTFITAGGFHFSGQSTINIGVINLNGDTLIHKNYYFSNTMFPIHINSTKNSGFIMSIDQGGLWDVLKLDSNFNWEWNRFPFLSNGCSQVIADIDNGYIAVGGINDANLQYGVARLNNSGDTIWTRKYGDANNTIPPAFQATNVIVAPDSNYIISTDGFYDWQLMKVNRNTGDTIWTKAYPVAMLGIFDRPIGDIDNAGNNTFICAFEYNPVVSIMLIDGNNGDTIWTSPNPFFYSITHVKKTLDGGYAYCGNYRPTQNGPQYMMFAKTDSLGHVIFTSVFDTEGFQPISFFPNPVSSELKINTSTFTTEKNLTITLTNMQGKIILQQQFDKAKAVEVSNLPNGMYVAEVRGKEKVVRGKVVVQH